MAFKYHDIKKEMEEKDGDIGILGTVLVVVVLLLPIAGCLLR